MKSRITEIIIKKFNGDDYFTCLIFKCNHLKPTAYKLSLRHHARIVLEQFTKLCSSELGGAIPSDAVISIKSKKPKKKPKYYEGMGNEYQDWENGQK